MKVINIMLLNKTSNDYATTEKRNIKHCMRIVKQREKKCEEKSKLAGEKVNQVRGTRNLPGSPRGPGSPI